MACHGTATTPATTRWVTLIKRSARTITHLDEFAGAVAAAVASRKLRVRVVDFATLSVAQQVRTQRCSWARTARLCSGRS